MASLGENAILLRFWLSKKKFALPTEFRACIDTFMAQDAFKMIHQDSTGSWMDDDLYYF